MALQGALEEDEKKDNPSFGKEDLEEIHRSGTEAGLLGIYNFPGSVYATDGSNDRGVMGAGFFKLSMNIEAVAANWAEGKKVTPRTEPN